MRISRSPPAKSLAISGAQQSHPDDSARIMSATRFDEDGFPADQGYLAPGSPSRKYAIASLRARQEAILRAAAR
jgi:hypothetical protein